MDTIFQNSIPPNNLPIGKNRSATHSAGSRMDSRTVPALEVPEIVDMAMGYLASDVQSLKSCSVVNALFHLAARRNILRSVTVEIQTEPGPPLKMGCVSLIRFMDSQPDVALFIKKLRLVDPPVVQQLETTDHYLLPLVKKLPFVTELVLDGLGKNSGGWRSFPFSLYRTLIEAVRRPGITTLHLQNCDDVSDLMMRELPTLKRLELSYSSFDLFAIRQSTTATNLAQLEALVLFQMNLEVDLLFFLSLERPFELTGLKTLHLLGHNDMGQVVAIENLFDKAQGIETLGVRMFMTFYTKRPLRLSKLPMLKSLIIVLPLCSNNTLGWLNKTLTTLHGAPTRIENITIIFEAQYTKGLGITYLTQFKAAEDEFRDLGIILSSLDLENSLRQVKLEFRAAHPGDDRQRRWPLAFGEKASLVRVMKMWMDQINRRGILIVKENEEVPVELNASPALIRDVEAEAPHFQQDAWLKVSPTN